jgi:hypothetical protein
MGEGGGSEDATRVLIELMAEPRSLSPRGHHVAFVLELGFRGPVPAVVSLCSVSYAFYLLEAAPVCFALVFVLHGVLACAVVGALRHIKSVFPHPPAMLVDIVFP